ncbi:MAG: zinc ABC transporter substrate-binding protein [Clostridia bacterium]|nr:zinc ABC transporter substrate-binding protein [Clostridia bacterium]
MKKIWLGMIVIFALMAGASAEGLDIVCTDFPCYDFARQVAGEGARVTMLLKPGTEAHAYDPTPADIVALGAADLFVYVGGESDAWADSILAGFDGGDAPATLRMMDHVSDLVEEEGDAHVHDGPEYDEHIWTSPKNALRMVEAVADALSDVDPENAESYRANAAAYGAEIQRVDDAIREIVVNAKRKTLVFADRFPFVYLTREYGLDYLAAFPSCTADTEPSAQTVMALINRVVSDKLPAVYTIELSTQAIARTVAEETGVVILTLHSMQTVSQSEFDAGATWASIMGDNVEALRKGLM